MRITHIAVGIVLSAATALAQNPARPAFEVVSIRPSAVSPQPGIAPGVRIDGAQFRSTFLTVKDYISMAYRVKLYQISGPDSMGIDRFDVAATIPEGKLPSDASAMMESLLEDRFRVKLHREKKDFPVYALEIGKDGLKIPEARLDPEQEKADPRAAQAFEGSGSNHGVSFSLGKGAFFSFANNKFEGKGIDMETAANILERFLDRPVVNATGLKGIYDFSFDVTAEDYRAMLIRSAVVAGVILPPEVVRVLDASSSPESLFAGLGKLGLKLETRKAPLDLLVIDSVLKQPTEN
jgi:uncharacterized protein (TIGR03435 family)